MIYLDNAATTKPLQEVKELVSYTKEMNLKHNEMSVSLRE